MFYKTIMRRVIALIAIFSAAIPAVRAQLLVAPQNEEKTVLSVSKDSKSPVSSIAIINNQSATFYPASLAAAGIDLQKEIKPVEPAGPEPEQAPVQQTSETGSSAQAVKEAFKETSGSTGFVEPSGLSKAISKDKPAEDE
jgi:hypothetical protein